ncbi:MAG: type I-E CRISPR-associated protein Cse2/CasB [Cycloclasticus sp.]|nr:MAG: type I-E CRISPR-associated protein Cse2/CasB [Cycloclasticus sp.]
MYTRVYEAYCRLSNGDQAELKRCNLKGIFNTPAYFRVLKMTGLNDNAQSARVLFLLTGVKITDGSTEGVSIAKALDQAGVKERHIVQIVRSGDNGIEYLKRQLIRCKNISLKSIGETAQFWGDNARRSLLKDFILNTQN